MGKTTNKPDPNGDGVLDVQDVTKVLDLIAEDEYDERADLNGDGRLTVDDVSVLLDAIENYKGVTIALDPGHTMGYNTVKYPDFTYSEGTRMFIYAVLLQRELIKRGYAVVLTRANVDDNPNYKERAETAAKNNADVLLSLHSNAKDSDPAKQGIVVMYSRADKSFNKPFGWEIAEADAVVMGHGVVDVFESESSTYPGEDRYAILRESVRAGITKALIIEHGYHSNEEEARFLADDANIAYLAQAEAFAIDNYLEVHLVDRKKTMYRVQVGSYLLRTNAEKKLEHLEADGFVGFVEGEGVTYKVYAGSYLYKKYAEETLKAVREKGYDAMIVEVEI